MLIPSQIIVNSRLCEVTSDQAEKTITVFVDGDPYIIQNDNPTQALLDVINLIRWKSYSVEAIKGDTGEIRVYWVFEGSTCHLGFPTREFAEAFLRNASSAEDRRSWDVEEMRCNDNQFYQLRLSGRLSNTYL
jgi:hypothetical protein